jgi:HEAT repeat protein
MKNLTQSFFATVLLAVSQTASGQSAETDREALQMAAMDALISAPEERALPLASKVLNGNYSDELKERALFVLSQIERPEAREALLATARSGSGELREEAVRMIGIGGDPASLAELKGLYADGDEELREAVLQAYLIADDPESVYEIAANAGNADDFEDALDILGAMGAREQLARLRDRADMSEEWIEAVAVSGDAQLLREIALDGSNPERQAKAIESLGIVGGSDVDATLMEIYRSTDKDEIRESALQGMLISGNDEGVLELYRESRDPTEKKELLEYLVMMDSDAIWEIVDQALEETE